MTAPQDPYDDREQTWVKHAILQQYLLRLAVIVGNWSDCLTYVDCFSGPWENKTNDYSDTSFSIAIEQLRAARTKLAERNKHLKLRCLFVEKNASAFQKLEKFSKSITDMEVLPIHGELENHIGTISQFVKAGGRSNFPFIFIDPTGWTGFPMDKITPLLQFDPGEVLVNFMTSHIRRFIDQEDQGYSDSFAALYGHEQFREKLRNTPADDREDVMVGLYGEELKKRGKFEHVVYTPVFQPEKNAIHFHLIYGSRHQKGLTVFKDGEKKAVAGMEQKRADAQQRKRQSGGDLELFASQEIHDTSFYDSLRSRYLGQLKSSVQHLLSANKRISYDKLLEVALGIPLVWESDLKMLLEEKKAMGKINFEGFEPRQKVPKAGAGNIIVVNACSK